jgi:gamma-tubulin complex component 2
LGKQHYHHTRYWEQRYTIRSEQVPIFLARVSEKILVTGKYLNVIRECGKPIDDIPTEKLVYMTVDKMYPSSLPFFHSSTSEKKKMKFLRWNRYVESIEKAFNYASKRLLDLVLGESKLLARLR